jgi:hypothetical protein
MPLKFQFAENSGLGNLGPSTSIKTTLAGLTGFQSFFVVGEGETLSGSAVSSWVAAEGTGAFAAPSTVRRPIKAARDGLSTHRYDGTMVQSLSGVTLGTKTNYTVGMRFYSNEYTEDVQIICGQDTAAPNTRILSRFANGAHRFESDTAQVPVDNRNGWRTMLWCISGGTAKLSIDGSPFATQAVASFNFPDFHIGNARLSAGDAKIDIRSVLLMNSDVSLVPANLAIAKRALDVA